MEDINLRYRQLLYRFFVKHVKIPALAEDLAQDVFLKYWQYQQNHHSIQHIDAWLFTMARNHLMDHYRKLSTEKKYQEAIWNEIESAANTVLDEVYKNELESQIQGALTTLPARQLEVYKLSREQGLTLDEIAQQLQISPNTAKNHLVQALKVLRASVATMAVLLLVGAWVRL